MGTKNTQPAGDLGSLLAGLGIDPASFTGGPMADPNDLPVFAGRAAKVPGRGEWTKEEVSRFAGTGVPTGYARQVPVTRRQSELERDFYATDPDSLAALQKRLYAGGFYPQGVDPNEVVLGVHDEQTYAAYQKVVQRAAGFYAAGKEHTIDDVLDMAAGVWGQTGGTAGRGGGGGGGRAGRQPLTVELTNPEDLQAVAQRTAVSTLGRALRPEELSRFVASFHASQRQEQTASYGAVEGGGTVTGAPSAATAAESFARRAAPTEAGANDVVRVYGSLSRILARRA